MASLAKVAALASVGLVLAGCAPIVQQATEETGVISITQDPVTTESFVTTESATADNVASSEPVEAIEEKSATEEAVPEPVDETAELLVYLIEEEKLAHDVYTVLYDMYGSNVFGNILESETKHQNQVMTLLDSYGVSDPRLSGVGDFIDPQLQALYDQLIALGSQSAADAYQVGVLIEERDIADITSQLKTATDDSVISVLQQLRTASEKHLSAFQRQL